MNTLAFKISTAIKNANPEETGSIEVLQYSLNIILNTFLIITCSLFFGWLLNNTAATLLFFASFSVLRIFSGGFHLRTATACNIVTTLLCVLTPYFFILTGSFLLMAFNMISFIIMCFFAPNPDKNARIPYHWFPHLKVISIFLVACNFFIGSSVLGLAFFVQSLTVLPWKRRLKL
ncbi:MULTISPECIES: accessory gene regulator ArgB-like protein [unclassified Paenibacillus]|uniref:accessory gene regulator ArgB-like protein n=1 Tax=unclassified Paenibacillus TaxID=185978 RepID=UPI0030FC3EAF